MAMYLKSYWTRSTKTGNMYELAFTDSQVVNRGWIITERGLPFVKAAKLVEEWNKLGNKNGYHYYLHKPEV